jgi:hypothetical protein
VIYYIEGKEKDDVGLWASTSNDRGKSWSQTRRILRMPTALPYIPEGEAEGGAALYVGEHLVQAPMDLTSVAVDQRSGRVHIAFAHRGAGNDGRTAVFLAFSDDGTATWSQPQLVSDAARIAFLPNVAIDDTGQVGVSYAEIIDTRKARRTDPVMADIRLQTFSTKGKLQTMGLTCTPEM